MQRHSKKAIWSCDFSRGPVEVARLGGVISGSPTFAPEGIRLNGTTDYITFPLVHYFTGASWTIVHKFTPEFEAADDNRAVLWYMDPDNRCVKYEDAISNILQYKLAGNTINISLVDYQAYWKANEQNTLIVTSNETGNSNEVYLNSTLIRAGGASQDLVLYPEFAVGSELAGANYFQGTMHQFDVHRAWWTADEVADDYNGTTWDYPNKASLWLDMETATTGPDGLNVTLDKSLNNHTVTLGDGAGTGEPTFKNPGYDLNGSTEYLRENTISLYDTSDVSIVAAVRPDFAPSEDARRYIYHVSADTRFWVLDNANSNILQLRHGGVVIENVAQSAYEPYWRPYGLNVFAVSLRSGDTDVFLNGFPVLSGDATAYGTDATSGISIGIETGFGSAFKGMFYHCSTYPFKLTPTQVRDLTNYLQNKYGRL